MRFENKLFHFLLCSFALLVMPGFAIAQDAKEKAEKEEERRLALQRKSYVLVDEIASGALSLKLPENRSFVIATAADLMWEHDEKRARNMFWDAMNTLNLIVSPPDAGTKKTAKEKERILTAYYINFGLRRELLRKVSARDPQLALDLLRATQQPAPKGNIAAAYVPDERELEQEIAAEAAARDPKRAFEIARESLVKGFSFQILELLFRLNQRDSELATKFAGEIIDKLATRNLATDNYAPRIAVDLLLMSRTPSSAREERDGALRLKLEKERRRELVEVIANAALGLSPNGNLLYAVNEVLLEFEEFAPERLPLLQRKLAAFNQTLNKEQKAWNEHNALVRNGDPEEMMRASRQLDDEQRDSLQQQAVVVAVYRRRADALREMINRDVEDESRRESLISSLDKEQIDQAVGAGNAKELRELLPHIRLREERARAMAEIAVLMEKNGDHDEAVKLLDEARTLIKVNFDNETQTNALMSLVAAYAVVEPAKAFTIIEKTIDRANDQISKLLLVAKILKSGVIRIKHCAPSWSPLSFCFKAALHRTSASSFRVRCEVWSFGEAIFTRDKPLE